MADKLLVSFKRFLISFILLFFPHCYASDRLTLEGISDFAPTQNPDRGFFSQIKLVDSLLIPRDRLKGKLLRVYFHLPGFKLRPLSEDKLADFRHSLEEAHKSHTSLIIRFIYDYPTGINEIFIRKSDDPTPELILLHIRQLSASIRMYPGTVTAIESGMFGFWGEQHGAKSDLQSSSFLQALATQWLDSTQDSQIPILIRYPRAWNSVRIQLAGHQDIERIGRWNDCVGAFDDEDFDKSPNQIENQIADFIGGELCQLPPRASYSCNDIASYLKRMGFSYLNDSFFTPTIQQLKKEGCYSLIASHLGYLYTVENVSVRNGSELTLSIRNIGWGRDSKNRELRLLLNDLCIFGPHSFPRLKSGEATTINVQLPRNLSIGDRIDFLLDKNVRLGGLDGNRLTFR